MASAQRKGTKSAETRFFASFFLLSVVSEAQNILAHHILARSWESQIIGQEYGGQEYFDDRTLRWCLAF
jgi:hypothetical protein